MVYFEVLYQEFDFGKFKGCDLGEVLMCSPKYVKWVIENVDGSICAFSDKVIEQIRTIFPNFTITEELMNYIKERQYEYEEKVCFDEGNEEMFDMEQIDLCNDGDTYERYNGSYAQDEMGYSDDDIDTIFDGDPSAYWNID
jgi:hypothetical protein